jgi:iron complex outermembrane recepter protein
MPGRRHTSARHAPQYSLIAGSIALAILPLLPSPVLAQEDRELILDEVIVTARKREESLQETPISMTVFDADTLREAGINNIKE